MDLQARTPVATAENVYNSSNNDDRDDDIERLEAKLDALLLALDVDPDSVGGED